MSDHHYDVIVAGAGPAGAAFCRRLSSRDPKKKILLLERFTYPRDKMCGDAVTSQCRPVFERVFPELCNALPVKSTLRSSTVHYPGCPPVRFENLAVDIIPRLQLDNILFQTLRSTPVHIWEGARLCHLLFEGSAVVGANVQVNGETRTVKAPWIIGADGSQSIVRRETGPVDADEQVVTLRQYVRNIPVSLNGLEIFLDPQHHGYFWIFPFFENGERWANVGYGTRTGSPRARWRYFLGQPELQNILRGAEWVGQPLGFPIKMLRHTFRQIRLTRDVYGDGYLLLGDAAGLVHPYTGEGISAALLSGQLAADALINFNFGSPSGPAYQKDLLKGLKSIYEMTNNFLLFKLPCLLPETFRKPYVSLLPQLVR